MKKIMVIDAQGGGIGKQLVGMIREKNLSVEILAVGTNSIATSSMLKAGATHAACGENSVIVGARTSDVILGPIGIVIADSMYGEITPAMASAIGQSTASKILIPINHCDNYVVGVDNLNMKELLGEAVNKLIDLLDESCYSSCGKKPE